jgi:hypothetical protein
MAEYILTGEWILQYDPLSLKREAELSPSTLNMMVLI